MYERSTIQGIAASRNIEGVRLPKTITDAIARADRIRASRPVSPTVAATVADARAAGRDPGSDPAVIAAVVNRAILDAERTIDDQALASLAAAYTEHADELVAAWRKPFDAAAAELNAAHAVLGDVALSDSASVVKKGGSAADAWVKATKAVELIGRIVTAWVSRARVTNTHRQGEKLQHARVLADLTPGQYLDAELGQNAWDLIRQGHELSLPTLDEYRARGDAVVAERVHRQSVSEEEMRHPLRTDKVAFKA
jgi:hypothetical protein